METALEMQRSGCQVYISSLADEPPKERFAAKGDFSILPLSASFEKGAMVDFIIVNTALGTTWIEIFLSVYPHLGKKIIWWIHEIDTELYARNMKGLAHVGAVIFDSHASLHQWKATGLSFPPLFKVIHLSVCDEFLKSTDHPT